MRSSTFVGRRNQLAVLEDTVRRADAGELQLVVVSGDAGIGKTRLLGQFADRIAKTGMWVLRTACAELGPEGLPLVPVTAALRQLAAQVPAETMAAVTPGTEALWRLLPESGGSSPEPDRPARLFDLFCLLLRRLATGHPVLWLIDDMQWADRSTRELLGFLVRTMGACRVAVVLAYRADDLSREHPLRAFLAELGHQPGVRRISLDGFSRAEVAELLAGALPGQVSDDVVDQVYRRSEGSPLYALELAQAGADEDRPDGRLPDSLRDLLLRGIGQLPETPRQVVRWAAVGGRSVSHALLAAAMPMPEADLELALRPAAEARVLLPERAGYTFRHDLVREAVAADLLPAERKRLHRRFAEALGTDPGLVPAERYAAETAYHWYEAYEAAQALPALLRAAEAAANIAAYAEQAQMLDRALRLWPVVPASQRPAGTGQASLAESAIMAATWAGDYHHALQLADQAQPAAEQAAEPHQASMLYAQRALILHNLRRGGALAAAEESLRLLPAPASARRAKVLELLGPVLVMLGRAEQAGRLAGEAARFAAEAGDTDLEISARSTLGWALTEAGSYHAAIETFQAALRLARGWPDSWQLVRLHLNLSKALHETGQYQPAIHSGHNAVDAARAVGMERTLGAYAYVRLATSLTAAGRWDEAGTTIGRALSIDPPGTCATALHTLHAEIALARGDYDTARWDLSLANTAAGNAGQMTPQTLAVRHQQAELAIADGRTGDARRIAGEALRHAPRWATPAQIWALLTTSARIEALARLEARVLTASEDGLHTAEELREAATGLPVDTPECAAYAAEFAAETSQVTNSWPDVVAAWDTVGNPYRAAHARLRAAAAVPAQRAAAGRWLREAAGQAARLGTKPLLDQIELLARTSHIELDIDASATGEPDLRKRLGLTGREMEVLRLITAGRSNRQIGEQLFISTKTASVHVSSILAKLGAASRGEAAAMAYRLRIIAPDEQADLLRPSARQQNARGDLR